MPRVIEQFQEIGFLLMFLLLIAAIVVPLIVWRVWRVSPRIGKLLLAIILLGGTTFVVAKSLSPAGKYVIGGCRGPGRQYFGITDDYYELSDGAFYDVVDGQRHRTGSYYRKNGHWILGNDRRDGVGEQELRFSVLGFDTIIPPDGNNEGGPTNFNRRRLVPFTKPSWMPEWLE